MAERGRAFNGAACRYVPAEEGFEDIHSGKLSPGGRRYTMQFTTPHVLNRSHSQFDNIPMLQDQFPQTVVMNPEDAAKRGNPEWRHGLCLNDTGCTKLAAEVSLRQIVGVIAIPQAPGISRAAPKCMTRCTTVTLTENQSTTGCGRHRRIANVLFKDQISGAPDPRAVLWGQQEACP